MESKYYYAAFAFVVVLIAAAALIALSGNGATLYGNGAYVQTGGQVAQFKNELPITWYIEGDADQIHLAKSCQNSQGQYVYNPNMHFQLQPVAYIKEFGNYVVAKNIDLPAHDFVCSDLTNYRWTWANWQAPMHVVDSTYSFQIEWHVIETGGASHVVQTETFPFVVLATGSPKQANGSIAGQSGGTGIPNTYLKYNECVAGWKSCYGGIPYYCYASISGNLITSGGDGCQAAPTDAGIQPSAGTQPTAPTIPPAEPQPEAPNTALLPTSPTNTLQQQCAAMKEAGSTFTWSEEKQACIKAAVSQPSCTPLIQRYNADLGACESYYDLPSIGAIFALAVVVVGGYLWLNRKPSVRRRRYG